MRLLTVIFHSKIFSKCDSFGEFLSYMEHVMMETPELLNKFEESETETCSLNVLKFNKNIDLILLSKSKICLTRDTIR